jgi:hypothetical protein
MSSDTSRRSLIAGTAALPAILAVPAFAATKPVSTLIEADEHLQRTADEIVEIAGKMIAEYDRWERSEETSKERIG